MRLSSESVSSHDTQGNELQKKDVLDEDEEQHQQLTDDVASSEPADQPGIIGFTE